MLKTVDMPLANHQWELPHSLQVYPKQFNNLMTLKVDINIKQMEKQQIKKKSALYKCIVMEPKNKN
jgi:hypothetical protein